MGGKQPNKGSRRTKKQKANEPKRKSAKIKGKQPKGRRRSLKKQKGSFDYWDGSKMVSSELTCENGKNHTGCGAAMNAVIVAAEMCNQTKTSLMKAKQSNHSE